jgi:hypothetical protein
VFHTRKRTTKSGKGQHFPVDAGARVTFCAAVHGCRRNTGRRNTRVYGSQQKPLVLTVNPEGALCGLCTRGDLIRQADSAHIDSS